MSEIKMEIGKGGRLNDEKVRFDLMEPFAKLQKAQVFTKGARKYAANNWLQGMAWSKCVASGMRHIEAFLRGEDYDFYPDTCADCKAGTCANHSGELHMAQAAWNFDAIASYYKWFPQGDDRLHVVMPKPKIGLDIDEVICDWVGAWVKEWNMEVPKSWFFDYRIMDRFKEMDLKGTLIPFYLALKPKISPDDIPFEPHCYITSRPVPSFVTQAWLEDHGFPLRPVITIEPGTSKVDAIKKAGVDIFVDDRYDNFEELNRNGICCYLMDAPHNQRYDVGYKRITSLKQLKR
jgi:5'(3')-deoxyribonucleotidase